MLTAEELKAASDSFANLGDHFKNMKSLGMVILPEEIRARVKYIHRWKRFFLFGKRRKLTEAKARRYLIVTEGLGE